MSLVCAVAALAVSIPTKTIMSINRKIMAQVNRHPAPGTVLAAAIMRIAFAILAFIPAIGFLVGWLAVILIALAWVITWVVVMVKALQGDLFKLPLIGHMAER